jgi:hypothetical protein
MLRVGLNLARCEQFPDFYTASQRDQDQEDDHEKADPLDDLSPTCRGGVCAPIVLQAKYSILVRTIDVSPRL